MIWQSRPLDRHHDLAAFDCGVDGLNDWLREHAWRAQQADTARTFVWTAPGDPRVVAYYAVSATQVSRTEISGSFAGGCSVVPAFLLARLALSQTLPGQALGAELLFDSLETVLRAADRAAARLIVVDAIDERAAAFYRHHEFVPVRDNPRRLVMKVSTARKALGFTSLAFTPDRHLRLVSLEWKLPDGTSRQAVASFAEIQAIAARLDDLVEHSQGKAEVVIELGQLVRDVLGRDPTIV